MNKRDLEQVTSLKAEIADLEQRLQASNTNNNVADSVKGSSTSFPYTECHKTIRGVDYRKQMRDNRYRKMITSKKKKIEKLLRQIEYDLNNVEDSEIRRIIRYKYFDNYSWVKIMHKMNYDSESKARMKIERFFENL